MAYSSGSVWLPKNINDGLDKLFGYTPVEILGEGSYGKVVKVKDKDGKFYAVKIYDITDLDMRGSLREAYYGSLLEHQNIVKILDYKIDKSFQAYLVMELADGVLSDYVNQEKLSLEDKIRFMAHLADAVEYVHLGPFAHCDLKASNILVFGEKEGILIPKIADAGISRVATANMTEQDKFVCQTVTFRSPEQFDATERHVLLDEKRKYAKYAIDDITSEIWSLGVVFLTILYDDEYLLGYNPDKYYKSLTYLLSSKDEDLYPLIVSKYAKVKTLNSEEDRLLKAICDCLLQINPIKRNIKRFIEHDIFNQIALPPAKNIKFSDVKVMYRPGGISLTNLEILVEWLGEVSNKLNTPAGVLANSIDYIIQHADKISNRHNYQLFVIVVMWIVEQLMLTRDVEPSVDDYIYLTDDSYTRDEFYTMLIYIVDRLTLNFDGIYYRLKYESQLIDTINTMINSLPKYIESQSPSVFARKIPIKSTEPISNHNVRI